MTAVNMPETSSSFVTREEFSSFVQILTSQVEAEEKLGDMRMSKLTETLNENMTEINAAIKVLTERTQNGFAVMNERINNVNDKIVATNERIDHVEKRFDERLSHMEQNFNEKLDHTIDALTIAISGTEKRLEDFREDLQAEQNKSLTKLGIRVALFIGAVQVAVTVILHFWGKF